MEEDDIFTIVVALSKKEIFSKEQMPNIWRLVSSQHISSENFIKYIDIDYDISHQKSIIKMRTSIQANLPYTGTISPKRSLIYACIYRRKFDKNDIFYYLGTNFGTNEYKNLIELGKVEILNHTASNYKNLLYHSNVELVRYSGMQPPKSFTIKFMNNFVSPNKYTLKIPSSGFPLENCQLVGISKDKEVIVLGQFSYAFQKDKEETMSWDLKTNKYFDSLD